MDSARRALRPKDMTKSFTELPHHLHKLVKGHWSRRCLRITGVALGKRFLFSLHAALLDTLLIVDNALLNCSALEEHERALEVMLEAVFLEPEEPVMWQTLAVMLRNRGCEFEYAFAHAMQISLENQYHWDAPGEDAPAPG